MSTAIRVNPGLMFVRHRKEDRKMDGSRAFLRFAAECEVMTKIAHDKESKLMWRRLAERWLKCANLIDDQRSSANYDSLMKRDAKPAHHWAH
jgi:hypothetical protein